MPISPATIDGLTQQFPELAFTEFRSQARVVVGADQLIETVAAGHAVGVRACSKYHIPHQQAGPHVAFKHHVHDHEQIRDPCHRFIGVIGEACQPLGIGVDRDHGLEIQ